MPLFAWMESAFLNSADAVFRYWPQAKPEPDLLRSCRLVSHRGEHDNRTVFENTVPAFEAAANGGVWGIEFDLRWTKDLHPVVFHDPDARRLFGSPRWVREMNLRELQTAFPLIPQLEEVVGRFGHRCHLMVEIKEEPYPDLQRQNRTLARILEGLHPVRDYHLISLSPHMFDRIDTVPSHAFLPIAELHVARFSRMAIEKGYGGLLGHYLLVSRRIARRHHDCGQRIGTGFADAGNCLLREINRGVDWIFSNRAAAMQQLVRQMMDGHSPGEA